jgi:hypothetical protein
VPIDGNYIEIFGDINSVANITLIIPQGLNGGSFDINTVTASAAFTDNTGTAYNGVSGTITITSLTSRTIAGTFQFTGTDASGINCTVTNGVFQTDYPVY